MGTRCNVLCASLCVCVRVRLCVSVCAQMTSWLQLHGLPYLSTDLGSRLSEAEDLILEQQEFQSKVKVIRSGYGSVEG